MTNAPFSLSGQRALITGGGSGIGLGIAQAMIDAGAKVCIAARREQVLQNAIKQLGAASCMACGDICKPEDRQHIHDQAVEQLKGPIDILVNCAGQNMKKPATHVSDLEFDQLLDTHVNAAFAMSRMVASSMLEQGRGNILFIASMASFMGVPGIVGYTTAKTAVLGLTRSLCAEWSGKGIRVNAIAPGWIQTDMTQKAFAEDAKRLQRVLDRTPVNHMGQPSDIGHAAVYLCSDAARFVTGVVLPVDGGASIGF